LSNFRNRPNRGPSSITGLGKEISMRIFYSSNSGHPMLLDREEEMHWLADELRAIVAGKAGRAFAADTGGSPAPYDELLQGLRVRGLSAGPAACHIAEDRWIDLQLSDADLDQLCRNLERLRNGHHTHLYSNSVSLIFEAFG
jgi:hypothetical protein